jgi:glycosyltransferase involved in cell wall biosynthesis
MNNPKVSVIIPTFNQSNYLAEALESVFLQTYDNFEVIVVNDASPDDTDIVIKQFDDPRLIYITHQENLGLPATRNTGISASSGEIIALLDSDDYFHREKLEFHVALMNDNPHIGVSYNARFNLNYSSNTIRSLTRPPKTLSLSNLVLGFPFTPSDMVIRREWIFRVSLFDESYKHYSEDLDINCRLALEGCKFLGIDRALNYRHLHSNRLIPNITQRLDAAIRALEKTFADPRCPEEVTALRNIALANHYLVWSYQAYLQGETDLGKELSNEAALLNPSILLGDPCEFVNFLSEISIADINKDHNEILQFIATNLPPIFNSILYQFDVAIARGYLRKAVRGVMWGSEEVGMSSFIQGARLNVPVNEVFLRQINRELLDYYLEFGHEAVEKVINDISIGFELMGRKDNFRFIHNCFVNDKAFEYYRNKDYAQVVSVLWNGFREDRKVLNNRGLLSILFRSLINTYLGDQKTYSTEEVST